MALDRACVVCGGLLDSDKRSDAITCSDVCRQSRHRYKTRICKETDAALDSIYHVAKSAAGGAFAGLAMSELEYILKYANSVHADIMMNVKPRDWTTDAE